MKIGAKLIKKFILMHIFQKNSSTRIKNLQIPLFINGSV